MNQILIPEFFLYISTTSHQETKAHGIFLLFYSYRRHYLNVHLPSVLLKWLTLDDSIPTKMAPIR